MSEYKDLYLSLLKNLNENITALQKIYEKSENAYIEMYLNTKENRGKGTINLNDIYKKDR